MTSEPTDVISEWKFLVNGDAKAGNGTKDIDGWTIGYEDGNVNFGKLIPSAETGKLCLLGFW